MFNKKSTKSSLLMSSIALLLCFSMLLGTTFAWFTDNVTSANNIIKSGNLDVAMYWADGKTDPATTTWADASTGAIFDYDNWEPGYAQVRHIKIANEGSLALKYKVTIAPTGTVSKLSDVIDVYYVDPAVQVEERTALTDAYKLGTLTEVLENLDETGNGTLASGAADTITIAFKMQESAGNEYQNLEIGSDFAVQVNATQLDAEEDSFGEDYDADLGISQSGTQKVTADGSTVLYYSEESGFAGRVRLSEVPGTIGSEYVVPAEVNDLGGALAGITLDKLTVPAGIEYAYKSLEGSNINEVVIPTGVATIPNRMFYKTTVNNLVVPASVTVIEENAFAMATVSELTIPASVTNTGEAAFQHMANLSKVTFEGNTAIQGYAFRGCANLREVYLNGEDVTFIASASGKNSCWFCNGESNNPGTSNITFYVKNETVAARVKATMGAECNKEETSKVKIYVNGNPYFIGTAQ